MWDAENVWNEGMARLLCVRLFRGFVLCGLPGWKMFYLFCLLNIQIDYRCIRYGEFFIIEKCQQIICWSQRYI